MYFNVNLEAVCTFARKKRFSGSLGYNLSKGSKRILGAGRDKKRLGKWAKNNLVSRPASA